jgi:hypothetical protein
VSEFLLKIDKTIRHYGRLALRQLRGAYWNVAQPRMGRPVFVIGCSRAGTTVVYKTFSEATELGSLQRETHDFWIGLHPLAQKHYASHALGADDASANDRDAVCWYFYSQTGRRRFVDKNNQNGLCVPYLSALFPDAHFVYVKRSPGDNINSLIEGWDKPAEFATWSEGLPVEVRVDGGRYRRWCFFLFDGWRDYVDRPIEDVCAAQYVAMNRAILDARGGLPSGHWTEILYEDLVRDPVAGFEAAFESAGLVFDARVEQHCRNVLGTPYNAFSPIEIDKWRDQRNRARIERVLPAVVQVAREMGYVV